jgi:hypothetical protein
MCERRISVKAKTPKEVTRKLHDARHRRDLDLLVLRASAAWDSAEMEAREKASDFAERNRMDEEETAAAVAKALRELGSLETLWSRTDAEPAWRLEVTAPECVGLQGMAHDLDNAWADSDVPPGYAWCLTKEKQHPVEPGAMLIAVVPVGDLEPEEVEARAQEAEAKKAS